MLHLFRYNRRNNRFPAIINSCSSFRLIVKNITAIIFYLVASITSLPSGEASIAAPKSIASLKNGKYLACIKKKRPNFFDGSQICFEFIKQGTNIKGDYFGPEGPGVCVIGTIKRNILTGSAYDDEISSVGYGVSFDGVEELRRNLPKSKPIELMTHLQAAEGKLEIIKVGKDIKTNPHDFSGKITYKKATLNLSDFKYISSIKKIDSNDCVK
jgi:hypothetical protein